jgi:hypothetical protein
LSTAQSNSRSATRSRNGRSFVASWSCNAFVAVTTITVWSAAIAGTR